MLGAQNIPSQLWPGVIRIAGYIPNRTRTDVLEGNAPLEMFLSKPFKKLKHMPEFGSIVFKPIKKRTETENWHLALRKRSWWDTIKTARPADPGRPESCRSYLQDSPSGEYLISREIIAARPSLYSQSIIVPRPSSSIIGSCRVYQPWNSPRLPLNAMYLFFKGDSEFFARRFIVATRLITWQDCCVEHAI